MKNSTRLNAVALFLLTNLAYAVPIESISDLDIGGTLYDVTFHEGVPNSFIQLWDADNDGTFGGGGSVFNTAPTFWGDESGALDAADAIIIALGLTDTTTGIYDGFLVPYAGTASTQTGLSNSIDGILSAIDVNSIPGIDGLTLLGGSENPPDHAVFVSFAPSKAVPEPTTLALLSLGLAGLGLTRRRMKA